jgi:hypothetical protein
MNGKFGIIDNKNFVNIINEFDWIDNYSEIMRAKKNNGYGVINKNSLVVIPFEYERIDIGPGNTFILVKNGKYGFGDINGCLHSKIDNDFDNKLIPSELIRIPDPKKQQILFKVIKDDEQGIMNQNGKILGEIGEYEEIYLPSCGLIRVMGNDKYFYLDMKMKPAFNSKFDEAEDYINNFAAVKTKGKWQIIDLSGKVVFNENCESIERPEDPLFTNDYFLVKTNSGIGLLNQQMAWALTPKYQEIEFHSDGTVHALAEGKQVYIDLKKNKIIWKEE